MPTDPIPASGAITGRPPAGRRRSRPMPALARIPSQQDETQSEQVEGGSAGRELDVRRAASRLPERLSWVLDQRVAIGRVGIGQDRRRAVPVPDLHAELVHDLGYLHRHQLGRDPVQPSRVGLVDRQLADRATLGVVARKQRRVGRAMNHQRKLPREVVRVVDAGIAAEPAVGRHHVGRVAGQEDPARLVALGHVGGGHPFRDVVDLHGKARHPDGGLDEPGGVLLW